MTLRHNLNRTIKAVFSIFGVEISRQKPVGRRRMQLMRQHDITTVIDVGANCGQYGNELREFGFEGRIISLEPLIAPFGQLRDAAALDLGWDTFRFGASNSHQMAEMNVASNSVSSSVMEMADLHMLAAPNSRTIGREQVELVRLDSGIFEIPAESNALLKLDVQGHELAALEGAAGLLDLIELIEMEVSIRELYSGQPLLLEAASEVESLGFELVALEHGFTDPRSGAPLQFDATFSRRRDRHGSEFTYGSVA